MEYQDNLGLDRNLSRKELQELCKKNNLPANRSTTQLAKSLASFFKKEVTSSAFLKVRSNGMAEAASYNSCLLDTGPGGTPFPGGEFVIGAYEKSVNSSESVAFKMLPVTEEKGNGGMPYCQTQGQFGNSDFMNHQTLDNACDTGAMANNACTFDKESTDVVECSLSEPGDKRVKSSVAGDIQHVTIGSQLGSCCHHGSVKNESQNYQNPRNCSQRLLVNTARNNDAHLLESPTKIGYSSSYESSIKAAPSFDFFVMSDEGINLYVDLNSSPSVWMKNLKDEVCINQKIQPQSLGFLSNHVSDFLDVDGHMKSLQSRSIGLNLQKKGADRETGCTNSSLSSVFSGNCLFEVYPLDATVASSGSSILTSNSNQVDISASLEGNQVVSSSCIAYSNFQNLKAIDNTSLHQEENTLRQDKLDVPFRVEKRNTDNKDGEVSIPGNSASTIYEKNTIQKSDDHLNNVEGFDDGTTDNDVCGGPISSLERESRCGILFGSGQYEKSSGSCQLDGQLNVNSAAHLCCHPSNSLKDSVPKDSNSTFGENLRESLAALEKERLECPNFQNSPDENSKRSCSPEFDEEILNKRHHSDRNNKKGYLGCTMSSMKEIVNDATIPLRRSSRFLSKVKLILWKNYLFILYHNSDSCRTASKN